MEKKVRCIVRFLRQLKKISAQIFYGLFNFIIEHIFYYNFVNQLNIE
jgi:hypothetical protein